MFRCTQSCQMGHHKCDIGNRPAKTTVVPVKHNTLMLYYRVLRVAVRQKRHHQRQYIGNTQIAFSEQSLIYDLFIYEL